MRRKIMGVVVALLLATAGTVALVAYVQSAKDEAVAGEQLVDVYVLAESVAKGASADEIRDALRREQVPTKVRADGAITDPSVIGDTAVAAVDLRAGEQLLESRIVDEQSLARVAVPAGLQELTLALEPHRAVGGELRPGDTVGIVLSFEPFEMNTTGPVIPGAGTVEFYEDTEEPPATTVAGDPAAPTTTVAPKKSPNMTHLTLHQVVVTHVQFGVDGGGPLGDDEVDVPADVGVAPTANVLVTLALSASEVEQVVFAAEFGSIWLTSDKDADPSGTRVVTLLDTYDPDMTT